jgi:hypothetical protein
MRDDYVCARIVDRSMLTSNRISVLSRRPPPIEASYDNLTPVMSPKNSLIFCRVLAVACILRASRLVSFVLMKGKLPCCMQTADPSLTICLSVAHAGYGHRKCRSWPKSDIACAGTLILALIQTPTFHLA